MNIEQLKRANFDDIVFDGRNKQYGAYELRKLYWKRLLIALAITMVLVIIGFFLFRAFGKEDVTKKVVNKQDLQIKEYNVGQKKKQEQKKVEKKEVVKKQEVKVVQNTEPVIKKDVTTPPARTEEKDNAKNLGQQNKAGSDEEIEKNPGAKDADGDGIADAEDVCPSTYGDAHSPLGKGCPMPSDKDEDGIADADDKCPTVNAKTGKYYGTVGLGCPEKPVDAVETKVDVAAAFKGNWIQYLSNTIEYPEDAQENGIEGRVTVKYIVDLHGNISDVKAVSGPQELRKEAERAVRASSGKWTPAQKGGQAVKAYGSQVVTFQLE